MIYKATTIRTVQFMFFLLMILLLLQTKAEFPWLLYYIIPFAVFILATIFMNFKFKIHDGALDFQIRIFTLAIYKRKINHNQIKGMKFKRTGWGKKCAIVQSHKGFNFRITHFKQEIIYNDLIDFANDYEIPIFKTKDYLILEKLK